MDLGKTKQQTRRTAVVERIEKKSADTFNRSITSADDSVSESGGDSSESEEENGEIEHPDHNEHDGGEEEDEEDEEEEEEEEMEDELEEDGDIDAAIKKADAKKKQSTVKQRREYLNLVSNITTPEDLETLMRKTFMESQTTVAAHKRELVILKALMVRAYALELNDKFNMTFCKLLSKILPLKRNIKPADKVVKFVSSFFENINPLKIRDGEELQVPIPASAFEEVHALFINKVVKYLMKGLDAKDTTVRYRSCQLLYHIIGNSGAMDEDLYESISDELSTKVYDKDAAVRVKAIAALACFQNEDGGSLSVAGKKIRFIMQNDLNAEVRRACLKHIEKNRYTEPFIVERARDVDTVNRRTLYTKILPTYSSVTEISSANRNKLLEWGLRDRDESVRNACANWLTNTWMSNANNNIMEFLDQLNVTESEIADTAVRVLLNRNTEIVNTFEFSKEFYDNLTPSLALLLRVTYEYCHDNQKEDVIDRLYPEAAEFAVLFEKFFVERTDNLQKISENREKLENDPNIVKELEIVDPDDYDYIVKQLLMIAVDYDYSDEFGRNKMYSILRSTLANNTITEPLLPLLMECLRKLAVNERDFCQMTVEIINDLKDNAYEKLMQEKKMEETQRRRESEEQRKRRKRRYGNEEEEEGDKGEEDLDKGNHEVSDLNERVAKLLNDDGDISDEQDSDDDSDEYHSAVNEMSRQSIIEANKSRQEEIDQVSALPPQVLTDCLTITKCMLQLVFSPLRENMLLISLLDNFIVPCVNERSEVEVRELALICHGLCGLLDKEVAVSTMVVAGIFVTRSDYESFVVTGLKVIGDLLTIHGISILQSESQISIDSMAVAKVFYRTLKDQSKPEAQTTVAITLFKLFLCGVITDDELFETTLLAYFNPKVNNNPSLKQCLTFCIPTYAFSHQDHQELIANIVYDTISRIYKDWPEIQRLNQENEIKKPITANFIIESLLYWTDPYNLAMVDEEEMEKSSNHLDVGIQFMKLLRNFDYNNKLHRTLYKPILRALSKLTFTSKADLTKLRKFSQCFDDETLCQGDLDEVLKGDAICKTNFLKSHTYVQDCLRDAEARAEANADTDDIVDAENNEANTEVENEATKNNVNSHEAVSGGHRPGKALSLHEDTSQIGSSHSTSNNTNAFNGEEKSDSSAVTVKRETKEEDNGDRVAEVGQELGASDSPVEVVQVIRKGRKTKKKGKSTTREHGSISKKSRKSTKGRKKLDDEYVVNLGRDSVKTHQDTSEIILLDSE